MSKQANKDNRANQLNPNNPKYLKSRGDNLTPETVKEIQRIEVRPSGEQSPKGLGAEAQRILDKKGQ